MEPLTLMIDTIDSYQDDPSKFYIHPCRIQTIRCVKNNSLQGAQIVNTPVSYLTAFNLVQVLEKIAPLTKVEVTIFQPVTVMQEYDAKQVEANAKLAGFENISIDPTTFIDNDNKKINTLLVIGEKPEKGKANTLIEVTESVVETTNKSTHSAKKRK